MKKFSLALAFVLVLASFSGCMDRNSNSENSDSPKENAQAQITDESNSLLPLADKKNDKAKEEKGEAPRDDMPNDAREKDREYNFPDKTIDFSLDESKYSSLDKALKGWGPGGPVDENNRSAGAISYQKLYGKYNADFILPMGNEIILTFDEGYENGYTAPILDTLKEKGVKAVFFITYPYAKDNPELVRRMIDEGHIVGNHSTNHTHFPNDPIKSVYEDVLNLHNYVKDNFGYTMHLFRFPFGEFSESTLSLMNDLGYKSVFWSFAYKDWERDKQPDPAETLANLEKKSHGGAIYLLHAVSKTNSDILGDFIDSMRGKGYDFADYYELMARELEEAENQEKTFPEEN